MQESDKIPNKCLDYANPTNRVLIPNNVKCDTCGRQKSVTE